MPNLGRDKIWTPEIWKDIDRSVLVEVGRIRVAQKVFPTVQMPSVASVSVDEFDPSTNSIQEGKTRPFLEIALEFTLTQSQADNEATLRTGRTLARLMAKDIASMEDLVLLTGNLGA